MKKCLRLLIILGLATTYAQAQQAQEVKSFSLRQAVDFAKQNNYALKNSQLDVNAAQKKVNEVLASWLPQINATGNYTNNVQIPTNVVNFGGTLIPIQFGQKYTALGSITASQVIFDGGVFIGVKAANEYINLSKLNLQRTTIETEVNVSRAYYMALLVKTNIDMMSKNIATLEKSRADLEKIYKNGLAEKTDFDRLTLQYSTLQLQLERTRDQQRVSEMVLKLQMGMSVNDSIVLTDKLDELYKSTNTPLVEARMDYSKRAEYQLLDQQIRLYNFDKKRYQFSALPSLSTSFTHQQNTFSSEFSELGKTWYPGSAWAINLNVPIFSGFRRVSQIQQAKISIRKSENDRRNLENVIDQEVFQSKMAFERAGQQLKIQEQNLQLAQDIYDRVNIKYKNGVGSSLELTTSQNDLETARANYLSNVYDYFVAQVNLRKAIGDIK